MRMNVVWIGGQGRIDWGGRGWEGEGSYVE